MKITSREELADYCLRRLGQGAIHINVTPEQVSDRIDDALQHYFEFHDEGTKRTFIEYTLTATDVTNKYITLPDTVTSVYNAHGIEKGQFGLFSPHFILMSDFVLNHNTRQIHDYFMMRTHLKTIREELGQNPVTKFTRVMNRLELYGVWDQLTEGDKILVECEQMIDIDTFDVVYNDVWLKEFTTMLIKRQWGENLQKFAGAQLPGGVTMNGELIYQQALDEIGRLRDELDTRYNQPLGIYMG